MSPLKRVFSRSGEMGKLGRWFLLSAAVGIVAGLGAAVFYVLSGLVTAFALESVVGYEAVGPGNETELRQLIELPAIGEFTPWLLLIVPAIGGLISGFLVFVFAPEAEGHGTDAVIEAYHMKRGRIRTRVPFIKTIASAITLGTGGSGGREGPIAQIGAGFGAWIADRLRLSARERRMLVAAGMGAGIGAIFKAPLAGALFAAEVLYRESEFEAEVLLPAMLASIIGFSVYASMPFTTFEPLFNIPGLSGASTGGDAFWRFDNAWALVPYLVLAIVVSIGAWLWTRGYYGIHDLFKRLPIPRLLKPMIGGLLTGALALGALELARATLSSNVPGESSLSVLAFGYGILQTALSTHEFAATWIALFLLIAAGKVLTTGFSIGSGGSGGVFGPSMVIGGCLGGAVGVLAQIVCVELGVPEIVPNPGTFIIVGMAGFFSGAARTPVSTVVMVSEMTGTYDLLPPSMFVCTLATLLVRGKSLYAKQVPTRADSPAHRGDYFVDLLENVTVRDVHRRRPRRSQTVPESMTLNKLVPMITSTHQLYFPVVDGEARVLGIFSLNDIREVLHDHDTLGDLVTAKDIATPRVIALRESESLNDALLKFTQKNLDELPVLEDGDDPRFLGMLSRRDVLATYTEKLHAWKDTAAQELRTPARPRASGKATGSSRRARTPPS